MRIYAGLAAALAGILCLAPLLATADEFHYGNLLIGDRASGMGGAYTALSDDATGLYYNPAGVFYASAKNLSASVNAFYSVDKEFSGVIGGLGWRRHAFYLLPNYFGIIQPLGKLKFGFSYVVTDSNREEQDQSYLNPPFSAGSPPTPVEDYQISFKNEDETYLIGPSLSLEVAKNLAAGATLYYYRRSVLRSMYQLITLQGGTDYEWTDSYYSRNEQGVRPILGVMWMPAEKVSVGASLSRVILTSTDVNAHTTRRDFGAAFITKSAAASNQKRKQPWELKAGAAYFLSADAVVAADLSYFTEVRDSVRDGGYGDRISVLNARLGAEYYLTREWAVRAGVFTDIANTPEITAGVQAEAEEHVDLYGGSMSVSYFSRNTSVTLGGSLFSGRGKAQITEDVSRVQDESLFGWTLFLSSSYSY